MSVRIKGVNKAFSADAILQRAIDLRKRDPDYGIPLHIVYLDWNPQKKNFHKSKTKGGFDDVFITRRPGGGLEVKYRSPGSLEWLKDGMSGEYAAMCPVTPKNLAMLASCYYDGLWTIRDAHIEDKVKEVADKIDEANKKIPHEFTIIAREVNPKTGLYHSVEKKIQGTLYDYHKWRRESNNFGASDSRTLPAVDGVVEIVGIKRDQDDLEQKKRELDAREKNLIEREKAAGIIIDVTGGKQQGISAPEFDKATLDGLHIGKLRKIARDVFGIEDAFKKNKSQLVPEILQIQAQPEDEEEPQPELSLLEAGNGSVYVDAIPIGKQKAPDPIDGETGVTETEEQPVTN